MPSPSENRTTTLSISLPTPLAYEVTRRVESGRYGSASEVVREALHMLLEADEQRRSSLARLSAPQSSTERFERDARHFERDAPERAARLRVAEAATPTRSMEASKPTSLRLHDALELFEVGVRLTFERALREGEGDPAQRATRAEREVADWLRRHDGAPHGDGPGIPASPERMRRLGADRT